MIFFVCFPTYIATNVADNQETREYYVEFYKINSVRQWAYVYVYIYALFYFSKYLCIYNIIIGEHYHSHVHSTVYDYYY